MLFALQAPPLPLVPLPVSVTRGQGSLDLSRPLRVVGPKDESATLTQALRADGVKVGAGGKTLTMRLMTGLPTEGYRLHVGTDGATVEASDKAGLFYGGQTFRQLITPQGVPAVDVQDAPRFHWRGMLLDVSRHFRPVADVKRIIDLNARMKLNVFHWHLTDDGGWRMESKVYPELTRRGAWRSSPPKGKWSYAGIVFPETRKGDEYGGFYTQAQIRDVVAYAARRHVTVVPEIEMPGHEQAALQSLPWLKCDGVPTGQDAVALCAGKPTTMAFVRKVLDETMALFPSPWIHIGGDEVEKRDWNRCPQCQARMAREGLKTAEELQTSFTREVDAYVASKGRRMIGWDEILEGGLVGKPISKGATVMSWRGIEGGIAAAKAGQDVVMSPTSHLYLDYSYQQIPTERTYAFEPVPAGLTPEEARHILGAQGNVWTEWLADQKDVEEKAYPRAAALAEVAWTPAARKSWPDFSIRLGGLLATWDRLKVAYHVDPPLVERTAYLSDEYVTVKLPTPPEGWSYRIFGATVLPTGQPTVMIPPETELRLAYVHGTDGAASPEVRVRVSRGGRMDSTAGRGPGLHVLGRAGQYDRFEPFSGSGVKTVSAIDLTAKPAPSNFALWFRGYVHLPKDGDYAFALTSDDGSVLKIGGLTVVDNDGAHAPVTKTGTVWAKAGVYPFELTYFDAGGANALSLTMNGAPIPADLLWH